MKKKSQTKLKLKLKKETIVIPLNMFKNLKTPLPDFEASGKKVYKSLKEHFTKKGQGWPLAYSFLVSEIFYEATGHHLENYILKRIAKSKMKLELVTKDGELVVQKSK
jgi:hypothetical protein